MKTIFIALFLVLEAAVGQTWVQKIGGSGLGNPLAVNPLDSNIIYAAAGTNRIYISRNRGYTWQNYANLVTGGGVIKSISVNPQDTLEFVLGMETTGGSYDHISKSTDGGFTWTEVWSGTFSYYGQPVEFDAHHPDTMYTMGADTIWMSTDFGDTWDTTAIVTGFNTWCDAELRPDSGNILYLGDNTSGIWKSVDYGATWKKVYNTIGEIPSIAFDRFNPLIGYASKYSGGGGIVKTTNGGETWSNITVPSGNRDTWWVTSSPLYPGWVYYGTYTGDTSVLGIYLSRNYGSTWERIVEGLKPSGILNYGLLALDSLTVVALQGNGVYKLQFPATVQLHEPNGGEYFQTGSQHDITWTSSYVALLKLEYSTNNGSSWISITDSIPSSDTSYTWTIPSVLSTTCKVRVSDMYASGATDMSDSTFVMTNALIDILTPQGGEIWDVGSTKYIEWTAGGVADVRIDYSIDSGSTWTVITTAPASQGSLTWTIPNTPSLQCKIRVTDTADSLVYAVSDSLFTIRFTTEFHGVIRVIDNGAEADTLDFGTISGATDGIDISLGEEELPPMSPPGSFDARWHIWPTNGSDTDYRDTLGTGHESNTYILSLQPGLGGYPMTIFWNPDSLTAGTFIMADTLTNGSIYSVDMRKDSMLVVTDATVKALSIFECTSIDITVEGNGNWELVSLPVITGDRRKVSVFPYSTSSAFSFVVGYVQEDTLAYGTGYWIKTQQTVITGCALETDTIPVNSSWNIIGSLSAPIAVSSIVSVPESIMTSSFFEYDNQNGYTIADSIIPGKGYWVKTNSSGSLMLSTLVSSAKGSPAIGNFRFHSLGVADEQHHKQRLYFGTGRVQGVGYGEMPPAPPFGAFDARFGSSKFIQIHPENFENELIYPISIQSASDKIIFSWDVENDEKFTYILVENSGTQEVSQTRLYSSGSRSFTRHKHSTFALKVQRDFRTTEIPRAYAMGNLYPNPFNPSTMFSYSLPVESHVRVTVYSVLGEEVFELLNEVLPAGSYRQEWNGRRANGMLVSSGLFYVRLTAVPRSHGQGGEFSAIQKVLFIK